jgi:hypothetical protein
MTYNNLPSLQEFAQILDQLTIAQMVQIAEANQQIRDEEITPAWSEIWGRVQHPESYDTRYQQLSNRELNTYRQDINAAFKIGGESINRVGRARGMMAAGAFGDAVEQVIYLILAYAYQLVISQASAKTFLTAWQSILDNPSK